MPGVHMSPQSLGNLACVSFSMTFSTLLTVAQLCIISPSYTFCSVLLFMPYFCMPNLVHLAEPSPTSHLSCTLSIFCTHTAKALPPIIKTNPLWLCWTFCLCIIGYVSLYCCVNWCFSSALQSTVFIDLHSPPRSTSVYTCQYLIHILNAYINFICLLSNMWIFFLVFRQNSLI